MVVRTLAHLKRLDESYAEIGRILADRSLREVHAIAANYRVSALTD